MAIIRVNTNAFQFGEGYLAKLNDEADRNFQIFLALLSSYWSSSIDGPMYARMLKAISLEIARLRLALESIRTDQRIATSRTEYLYQFLTSMMFPAESGAPDLRKTDEDFLQFLSKLVSLYFAGSVPDSLKQAIELLTGANVTIRENYLAARKPGSGFDISDQFGFGIDIFMDSPGQIDMFLAEQNVRILIQSVMKPSHTLYKLRFILKDEYNGPAGPPNNITKTNKLIDSFRFALSNYSYEDFRYYVEGVWRIDRLGKKRSVFVEGEDHSSDW